VTTPQIELDAATFAAAFRANYLASKDAEPFTDADLLILLNEMRETVLGQVIEHVLAEVPGAAEMSPVELSRLVSSAMAEVVIEAMSGDDAD
jgi:hypothetical protein